MNKSRFRTSCMGFETFFIVNLGLACWGWGDQGVAWAVDPPLGGRWQRLSIGEAPHVAVTLMLAAGEPLAREAKPDSEPAIVRQLMQRSPDSSFAFDLHQTSRPMDVFFNDRHYTSRDGKLEITKGSLEFHVRHPLFLRRFNPTVTLVPQGVQAWYLPLGEALSERWEEALAKTDSPPMLRMTDSRGDVYVVLRTAVEEQFLGHPLCLYLALNRSVPDQMILDVRSWREDEPSPETRRLTERLGRVRRYFERQPDPTANGLARFLWTWWYSEQPSPEWLHGFQLAGEWGPRLDSAQEPDSLPFLAMMMAIHLKSASLHLDQMLCDGDLVLLDPYSRGVLFDQVTASVSRTQPALRPFFDYFREQCPEPYRFRYASALAAIGVSASADSYRVIKQFFSSQRWFDLDPACKAAFAAHWRLPVTESEVDAVVALTCPEDVPGNRHAAVETLLLLDRFDLIPPLEFDDWFGSGIEMEEDGYLRRRHLAYLMSASGGRGKAASLLQAGQLQPELAGLIRSVLLQHLAATTTLDRFDRISHEEFRELLDKMAN